MKYIYALLASVMMMVGITSGAHATSWETHVNNKLQQHLSVRFTVVDFNGRTYYNQTYQQAQEILAETALQAVNFHDIAVYLPSSRNGNQWAFVATDSSGAPIRALDGELIFGQDANIFVALEELMSETFEAGWDVGYRNGYANGYIDGYDDGYDDAIAGRSRAIPNH